VLLLELSGVTVCFHPILQRGCDYGLLRVRLLACG
jgi:hypothetical protein